MLGLLRSKLPFLDGFGASSRVQCLFEVARSQSTVPLLRGVDLPRDEPILQRSLRLPSALNSSVVLLDVLLLELPCFIEVSMLLLRLNLQHAHVLVLALAPLRHGQLQAELAVQVVQLVR